MIEPVEGAPPLECVDLSVRMGRELVLRGVSLALRPGEILGILGRSGDGKTTLLRCLIGLVPAEEGTVRLLGHSLDGLSEDERNQLRRRVGMVFQSGALFDSLTVYDNVAFVPRRFQRPSQEELDALVADKLQSVGLAGSQNLMPDELSGGMRKRVAIARALAMEPRVMLYDEPMAGLDPVMCGALDVVIRDLRERLGMTSIIVSHDVERTFALADRVAMLYKGAIHAQGTPDELRASDDAVVRQFITGSLDGPLSHA